MQPSKDTDKSSAKIAPAWMLAGAITLAALGSHCAHQKPAAAPLPLQVRPILPGVYADELECLSPDVYARLVERERLRREYSEKLEVVICSTVKGGCRFE